MSLSNDAVVLAKDAFKVAYTSGDLSAEWRTSPPNDLTRIFPVDTDGVFVFRNIMETEKISNIHGTKFRDTAQIWIHVLAKSKPNVTTFKDALKAAHRLIWKNPGSGMKYILWNAVENNDHEDWKPQVFERIIKLELVWEDT